MEKHTAQAEAGRTADLGEEHRGTAFQGILLLLGSCLPVLGAVLLAPVLPAMAKEYAADPGSAVLVPMMLTAPALTIAVLSPFAGALADRFGRKRILLVALVAYAVLGVSPAFIDSLMGIVVTRVGVGVCEAFIMTVCTTLMGDYFEARRRDRYLSMQTVITTVSATLFLAVGGMLGTLGWRAPFWVYAVALVLAVPTAVSLREPLARSASAKVPVPWRLLSGPIVVTLFGGIVFYTLVVHLPFVLSGLGVTDAGQIGLLSAVASLATALGAFSFRFLLGHGTRRLLPVAFGLAAVGFVVVWAAGSVGTAMLGAVLASAGAGLLLPTLITWAIGLLEQKVRGTGTGVWTGALWIGQFVSPLVIAALGVLAGGLAGGIGFLGVAAAVVAAATGLLVRQRSAARAAGV